MTCELHSLPHTNFAGPIGDDAESENALVSAAQDLAQRIGATALVLKNRYLGLVELPQLPAFVTFEKDVPGSRQDILRSFNKGARYRVKRSASRDGLTASIGFELKTFYELLASSYQRLGTPLYPRRFFEAILDHFHTSAAILIVRHGNKPVAGVLAVSFRDTMTSLFSGEAAGVRNLGPNPFKYFSLMEWALDEGLERYNFGRTRLSNPGVLDFKRHLGFEPIALPYMIVSNACSPLPDPNRGSFNLASRVWSHFPRPVAERLGPLVVSLFPY
jgi:hypothetical protein